MRRSFVLALAFVTLAGIVRAETEMKPEAKAHLEKGVALYEKGEYRAAIAEFSAGYALDPKPPFLYAQAQAERLAGDCKAAVPHYEEFLQTGPEAEREAAARANLAKCKEQLAAEAPPPAPATTLPPASTAPPVPASTARPPVAPPPPAKEQSTEPFYTDPWGDVLVGAGVLTLGVGTYLYFSSVKLENRAEDAAESPSGGTYEEHRSRIERAETQRTRGVVLGAVGLGLITGGVLRWVLRSPEPAHRRTALGTWVAPRAGGVTIQGAFQ